MIAKIYFRENIFKMESHTCNQSRNLPLSHADLSSLRERNYSKTKKKKKEKNNT